LAEIIELREFIVARERASRRVAEQESLAEAIALLRENLVAVALAIRAAPEEAQSELLDRVDKLTSMLRYAVGMLPTA
jgi:hypothetical protein